MESHPSYNAERERHHHLRSGRTPCLVPAERAERPHLRSRVRPQAGCGASALRGCGRHHPGPARADVRTRTRTRSPGGPPTGSSVLVRAPVEQRGQAAAARCTTRRSTSRPSSRTSTCSPAGSSRSLRLDDVDRASLTWDLTDATRTSANTEVRSRAVKDAVAKAAVFAQAVGLGSVTAIALADPGMLGDHGPRAAATGPSRRRRA